MNFSPLPHIRAPSVRWHFRTWKPQPARGHPAPAVPSEHDETLQPPAPSLVLICSRPSLSLLLGEPFCRSLRQFYFKSTVPVRHSARQLSTPGQGVPGTRRKTAGAVSRTARQLLRAARLLPPGLRTGPAPQTESLGGDASRAHSDPGLRPFMAVLLDFTKRLL